MPCDQIRYYSTEFKAENRRYLEEAVKSLGWKFVGQSLIQTETGETIRLDAGQATSTNQAQVMKLKQAYGQTALNATLAQAKAKGFTAQKLGNKVSINLKRS